VVKNDGSTNAAMDDFLKVCPDITNWKDGALNQLVEADGYYDISFMTDQNTGLVKEDGSFVVEIPFIVKNDAAKKIIFQIPHGSEGTMAADIDTNEV
jgi:predicted  nucleic acid-binding Zn-ribbon protein